MNIHEDHWRQQHKTRNMNRLSGTRPEDVFHWADLEPPSHCKVLDIGVGTGGMARYLLGRGNEVWCYDLVNEASRCLPPRVYFTTHLPSVPPVDFAIAHLVLQHMAEDAVDELLHGIRLTAGGVFAFQTMMMAGLDGRQHDFSRPVLWYTARAKAAGLEVVRCIELDDTPKRPYEYVWHYFHCRRAL